MPIKITAAEKRRRLLISRLKQMRVYLSKDNRKIEKLSLYELEWLNIQILNEH